MLPVCRHRGDPTSPGHWHCFSPKVICPGNLVTSEMCRSQCAYVDHPQDPRFSVLTGAMQILPVGTSVPVKRTEPALYVSPNPALFSLAMLTAPRVVPVVDESLRQLRLAGFKQPIELFAEPDSPWQPVEGVNCHIHTRRQGCWGNFRSAAKYLLEHTTSPFLVIFEDDILVARDAALGLQHAVEQLPTDNLGYISLYTPWHNVIGQQLRKGWQALNIGPSTWGALGYCFSRESLEFALAHTPEADPEQIGHPDVFISALFARSHRPCYFHVPSLCSHAGQQISTLGHNNLPDTNAVDFEPRTRRYLPFQAQGDRKSTQPVKQRQETIYALTSLSPAPECVARTRLCIDSWRAAGLHVRAFNHPSEIEVLATLYDVEFVPVAESTIAHFGRHYIPLNAILDWAAECDEPVLLINADIELKLSNWELRRIRWLSEEGLCCLVRYNHHEDIQQAVREPHGIDGFLFQGRHANLFPPSFLSVGQPAWDYWIPQVFDTHQLPIFSVWAPVALHRAHTLRWSSESWMKCALELERVTDLAEAFGISLSCPERSMLFRQHLERRLQVLGSKPPSIYEWLRRKFGEPGPKTFLELGAHKGTDTRQLAAFPGVTLHAFEPDPRNDQRPLPNVTVHRQAISDQNGHTQLILSEANREVRDWTYSSSIKQPKNHLLRYPVTFGETVEVPTITLDTIYDQQHLGIIDFIWADIQGAEAEMIRGGQRALAHTRYLYTEYSDDELYQDQPTLKEILTLLPNFRVRELWPEDVLLENTDLAK